LSETDAGGGSVVEVVVLVAAAPDVVVVEPAVVPLPEAAVGAVGVAVASGAVLAAPLTPVAPAAGPNDHVASKASVASAPAGTTRRHLPLRSDAIEHEHGIPVSIEGGVVGKLAGSCPTRPTWANGSPSAPTARCEAVLNAGARARQPGLDDRRSGGADRRDQFRQ
jgi:hypothetical protein